MRSDTGDYLLKLSILGPKFSESPCTRQQHHPTIAKTVLSAKLFYCDRLLFITRLGALNELSSF
uniref:Uncharacterized protein n=1 Tax=Solanum tuberosum TaxID=4113 RepID=M0ZHZ8_SOLTU